MEALLASLLLCLDLSTLQAGNGFLLRGTMIEIVEVEGRKETRCTVLRATTGKRGNKKWLNATIDCKCK